MNDFNNFNKFHLSNILSLVWPTSASLEMIYEKNCLSQHFTIKAYQRYFYDFYSDLIMHFFLNCFRPFHIFLISYFTKWSQLFCCSFQTKRSSSELTSTVRTGAPWGGRGGTPLGVRGALLLVSGSAFRAPLQ